MHGSSASRIVLACLLLAALADIGAADRVLVPISCRRNGCGADNGGAHHELADAIRELLPTPYAAAGQADIALAAGLLDGFLRSHGAERHNTTIGRAPGEYGELIPVNQHVALLLGEARKMLREPEAAAAALERAAAWADATEATKMRARRHLVGLYAGPLDDMRAATRVCHDLITQHAGTPVTDRLTERWADVEAAQKIVELWSTQPVDTRRLRRECDAMLTESNDDAVRMVATAGLVRASVAAGQRAEAVRITTEVLRRVPSLVRMVDPGAPGPSGTPRLSVTTSGW